MDCSYTGTDNFGGVSEQHRCVPTEHLRELPQPPFLSPSCDRDIYSRGTQATSVFASPLCESHVLLMACNGRQYAYESQEGGIFTRALLDVLKEWQICDLTYQSLIDRLDMPF